MSNKASFKRFCEAQRRVGSHDATAAMDAFYHPDAAIHVVHPFNTLAGPAALHTDVIAPLRHAFDHLQQRRYIAFGGECDGAQWVTGTGYFSGLFARDWLGIKATGDLAHLRFGEFHRMQDGCAIETYLFLDIPELMIAAGQWPIATGPGLRRGYTAYLPGPLTGDGLQWHENEPARGASSVAMVTAMLRALATEDQAWRPYWCDDMLWYGPAAFGSFIGLGAFADFQVPFENAFSEWIGGAVVGSKTRHFARFADGDYICSGGWPSLNMVQAKPFLEQPVTDKRLTMRVSDWWRREGDLLAENWVFVDIPDVLLQLGFDVFNQEAYA
ncbi:MAG: nuclear transport factor 2 family protein [Pseudomonadota bacterium]